MRFRRSKTRTQIPNLVTLAEQVRALAPSDARKLVLRSLIDVGIARSRGVGFGDHSGAFAALKTMIIQCQAKSAWIDVRELCVLALALRPDDGPTLAT